MVKRFVEEQQIRQVDPTTGAAGRLGSLADRLESFSEQAGRARVAFGAQAGQREASQVDITRDEGGQTVAPEFRDTTVGDLLLTGGERTRAYNATLRDGYLASLENDVRVNVAKIRAENPDDLVSFNEQMKGMVKGTLESVEPSVRPALAQFIDRQVTSSRISVQSAALNKNEAIANAAINESIISAGQEAALEARQGKPVAAANALRNAFANIDALVENGTIGSDEGTARKRDLEREATEQTFRFQLDNVADSEGIPAAFAQLDNISQKPPKGFTPDEWDTFVASAQADLNQKRTRQIQAESAQNIELSREISNIKIQASTDTGNAEQIVKRTEELFSNGDITEAERTSIFTNLINNQRRQQKEAIDFSTVANRLAGDDSQILDDDVIDKYYTDIEEPTFGDMTPEQKRSRKALYVNRTKRVPAALKAEINTFLQSDNAELQAEASRMIDLIDDTPGLVDREFSASERAFASQVVELSANLTPNEATRLARQLTDPSDKNRIDTRTQQIQAEKLPETYRGTVDSHFNTLFKRRVDDISGDQLAKEYGDLFEAHFKAGMTEQNAKKKALQLLERNWTVSDVTGRVMKYAPDQYYQVGGDVSYIQRQLTKDVNDEFLFEGESVKSDELFLQATEETARSAAQGQPVYRVVRLRDGNLEPIYGVTWKPDMQKEINRVNALTEEQIRSRRREAARRGRQQAGTLPIGAER